MTCPLCDRDCPDAIMQRHHLRTRRKDKADTELICRECHKTIHGLWTNQELRDEARGLDSVEGILATEEFQKARAFIRKVTPGAYMQMRQRRGRRGRN